MTRREKNALIVMFLENIVLQLKHAGCSWYDFIFSFFVLMELWESFPVHMQYGIYGTLIQFNVF